jgi:NADH:ubiquinone oxidoreductase subunit 3 (subunit A)
VDYLTELQAGITAIVFFLVGLAIVFVTIGIARLLVGVRPKPPGKLDAYESGEIPIGDVNLRFNVNYYIFALLFLLFDVEAALLFPWAVAYDKLGWLGFFEAVVFIGILAMGLVYAWRRGVLKWVY